MSKKDEALNLALEALKQIDPYVDQLVDYSSTAAEWPLNNAPRNVVKAITAIRKALAEQPAQQQEPVATVYDAYDTTGIDWHCKDAPATGTKLYTTPPQREWVGLTDGEIDILWNQHESRFDFYSFSCDIEAKLKEKNT